MAEAESKTVTEESLSDDIKIILTIPVIKETPSPAENIEYHPVINEGTQESHTENAKITPDAEDKKC